MIWILNPLTYIMGVIYMMGFETKSLTLMFPLFKYIGDDIFKDFEETNTLIPSFMLLFLET